MTQNLKTNIKHKLRRIRMELDILNSDLRELEDTGFSSKHLELAVYYIHLAINELSTQNIKEDMARK